MAVQVALYMPCVRLSCTCCVTTIVPTVALLHAVHYGMPLIKLCMCAEIPLEALTQDDLDLSLDSPVSSLDFPVTESRDGDMEKMGAEPAQETAAVTLSSPSQSASEMEQEANAKGYGKAYAAFGGGRDGLEACAASKCIPPETSNLSCWYMFAQVRWRSFSPPDLSKLLCVLLPMQCRQDHE